jgi:hypothetical protein
MATTDISEITTLLNTILVVTIPSVIGLALGILNFINHRTNDSKIHDVTGTAATALTKANEVDSKVAANIDKVGLGLQVASDLSPQVKDAIVASHPKVIALENDLAQMKAKIDALTKLVNPST